MIIAKNDEEKRSKIWRWVTTIASIVIVVVAVYFLITLFAGNPLEGTWTVSYTHLTLPTNREV